MSGITFGKEYSQKYDAFYSTKDYANECKLLYNFFRKYASVPIKSIIDLGCGTGGHSLQLAKDGYSVLGVDLSENMLAIAKEKAAQNNLNIKYVLGNVQNFETSTKFDAAIMMFAVIGYQSKTQELINTLKTTRKLLNKGSIFVFDCWYGPAVLNIKPDARILEINKEIDGGTKQETIIRYSSGDLDCLRNICKVNFKVLQINGDHILSNVDETHIMRYFFLPELKYYLEQSGFSLESVSVFPTVDKIPTENDWNIIVVAKAV